MFANSLFTLLTERSRHWIIPALPPDGGGDWMCRIERRGSFEESIKGLTAGEIWSEDALPKGGYSFNHSVVTGGILHTIQVMNRNKLGGEQKHFQAFMTREQVDFLWREPGMSGLIQLPVHYPLCPDDLPALFLGLEIYGGRMPKWRLSEGQVAGTLDFVRVDERSSDYMDAPYTVTIINAPDTECSWVILHRNPYKVEFGCSILSRPGV